MARNRPLAGHRTRLRPDVADRDEHRPAAVGRATAVLDRQPASPAPTARPDAALATHRTGWSRGARTLLAGLLALAIGGLALAGVLTYRVRTAAGTETARGQALAAAQEDAVEILSYDYRHLDADFARARGLLTGSFARDYRATTAKVVRPTATRYHAVVQAEVAAASVVSATSGRVVTLLFVNQTTTSTRLDGPKVDLNRVRLTMDKVGSRWLVSDVEAL